MVSESLKAVPCGTAESVISVIPCGIFLHKLWVAVRCAWVYARKNLGCSGAVVILYSKLK